LGQVGRGARRIATGSRRSRARSATAAVIPAAAATTNRATGTVLSSPPPTAGAMVRPTHHEKPRLRQLGASRTAFAHLYQVTIGVTDVRANLAAVVLQLCEKFCALGLPLSISPRNIRDPNA
jgi:hypothetical protein